MESSPPPKKKMHAFLLSFFFFAVSTQRYTNQLPYSYKVSTVKMFDLFRIFFRTFFYGRTFLRLVPLQYQNNSSGDLHKTVATQNRGNYTTPTIYQKTKERRRGRASISIKYNSLRATLSTQILCHVGKAMGQMPQKKSLHGTAFTALSTLLPS